MSTINSSKQMEIKLYNLVSCLADNYGFDVDEADEFVRWGTDVNHVEEILNMNEKTASPKKAVAKKDEPVKDDASSEKITTCRKNIELWQKKLDDGKSGDADKQREKIDKEQKKLDKLLEKLPVKKEEPKKKESKKVEPKKEEPKLEEVKEKRIKRFSPVMASQLDVAFKAYNVVMTDKLKKEFQKYVEDLTDDNFRQEGLADHMRTFAKLNAPVHKVLEEKAAEDTSDGESCVSDVEDELVMNSNSKIVDITLKELQDIGMTATIDPPGTFWDADNGRFVKGPDADDDEDFEDVNFNSKKYVVGEKTGRVYEARDTGDVFAGFIGVGKFKEMTK